MPGYCEPHTFQYRGAVCPFCEREQLPQPEPASAFAQSYDRLHFCRYCGAPCKSGGVCVAHKDVLYADAVHMDEAAQAATFDDDADA